MKDSFDKWKFVFMAFYATAVTFVSFLYFFAVSFRVIPEDNVGNVNIILGFLLGTAVSSFIGYFFGSSQSAIAHGKKETKPEGQGTISP